MVKTKNIGLCIQSFAYRIQYGIVPPTLFISVLVWPGGLLSDKWRQSGKPDAVLPQNYPRKHMIVLLRGFRYTLSFPFRHLYSPSFAPLRRNRNSDSSHPASPAPSLPTTVHAFLFSCDKTYQVVHSLVRSRRSALQKMLGSPGRRPL